ncbi:hypothetical protein MiHa_03318 [Microcystis aeruginosa NIES-2522]|uniref:hypothetical protein n=1 Tax=Microcystis aeruginosa TaxID=1126 RepID=UPI001230F710|nr:hypothetical protein [Microcystis aeruginosa]GCA85337.1 hypothetical protein MiHa_03318 [Microcystis aeruginosa NIES-2522]
MEYQNFSLIKEDIQADAWGRISLGTECSNRHYRILMNTSGELLLVPMVAIPEGELWAFQNPSVRESLKRGLAEASTGNLAEETVDLDAMLEFAASIPEEVEE